ncbi:TPA: toprim domain-containing protein, partial [Candidatus Bathyarchaeota archaeon]|nr:toprim domain-containing protein [Candidatus Bathyarchaeota archaeon]
MIAFEEKYELLRKLVEVLVSSSESGAAIIVEGKRDESSLKRLGVRKGIFRLKALNKNFYDFVFEVEKAKEAILMLDFDKEGEKMAKKLIEELTKSKVKVNNSIWR